MDDLSPTAQAIVNAALKDAYGRPTTIFLHRTAAALRAAADQVVPDKCPPIEDFNEFDQGYAVAHLTHRQALLAIAAELEGATIRSENDFDDT
jgi:hypothetical protein